jgi:hypothetical protein
MLSDGSKSVNGTQGQGEMEVRTGIPKLESQWKYHFEKLSAKIRLGTVRVSVARGSALGIFGLCKRQILERCAM